MKYLSVAFDAGDIWIALGTLAITLFVLLLWKEKLPASGSVSDVLQMLNSRGGNIAVLAVMSLVFFRAATHMYYVVLAQIQAGTLREDNAIALTGLQFITSTAFGGSMGALLKTMTGDSSSSRATDRNGNGNGNGNGKTPTVTNTLTVSGGDHI